jgi:hypothetical protein
MKNSSYIRGFLYINNCTSNYFNFQHNGRIVGSVYASPNGLLKFDGGSGVTTTIDYDSVVIAEIAETGVFTNPNESSSAGATTTRKIILDSNATKIGVELLGQYM